MPMMVEAVRSGSDVLCYIVRSADFPAETAFATPCDAQLQVGQVVHLCGHQIARHEHRPQERHSTGTAEFLLVQRGRCAMEVYDHQRRLVATRELGVGDISILLGGGHGFRMLEDTVMLEVKQGPYPGPDEKERF